MFPEGVAQPDVERHLLAIAGTDEIRLTGKQALSRCQPDKILRRFDLPLEMFVLGADVRHCFLRGMRLPVADEGSVGGSGFDARERQSFARANRPSKRSCAPGVTRTPDPRIINPLLHDGMLLCCRCVADSFIGTARGRV